MKILFIVATMMKILGLGLSVLLIPMKPGIIPERYGRLEFSEIKNFSTLMHCAGLCLMRQCGTVKFEDDTCLIGNHWTNPTTPGNGWSSSNYEVMEILGDVSEGKTVNSKRKMLGKDPWPTSYGKDGDFGTYFGSLKGGWFMVDLEDTYFVNEVTIVQGTSRNNYWTYAQIAISETFINTTAELTSAPQMIYNNTTDIVVSTAVLPVFHTELHIYLPQGNKLWVQGRFVMLYAPSAEDNFRVSEVMVNALK